MRRFRTRAAGLEAAMVFGESPLKDVYRRVVWGPWRAAVGLLPAGAELRLNRGLGLLAARLVRGKAAQLEANLRRAFPGRDDLDELVPELFATHFVEQYISWSFARIRRDNLHRYLRIDGLELLDRALEGGRGAVLMHPHMGPAQLPLCALGVLGYRVHQVGGGGVAGPMSAAGRWAEATRHALERGIPAQIHDGAGFLRPVLRALGRGEVVLSAMDGTGGGRELGRRLERRVLGQRMRVPVGAVYLALRSGAPLLPLSTRRSPGRSPFQSVIRPPVALRRDLPLRQALEDGADVVAGLLDGFLREHPSDWHFWDEFRPGRFLVGDDS